jgi:hypothetical protein
MNNDEITKILYTISALGLGYMITESMRPKKAARRTKKQIDTIKNNSEIKGYEEGYTDGKKDYKPKKK